MHSEGFGGRTCVRLVLSRGRVVVDLRCRRGLVASHVRSLLGDPPILHKNDPDRRVPGVIPQVSRARVQAARVSFEKSVAQECLRTVKWLLKSLCTCAFVHPFRDHLKCQVDLDHFGSTSSPDSERHFEHVWACELEKIEGSKGSIEEIEEMSEPYGTVCGGTSTDRLHLHRLVSWLSDWPWFANYCFQS